MYLYIVAGLALLVSLIFSREKTTRSLKIAARRFIMILPTFLLMIVLISGVLYLIPDEVISRYLGSDNKFTAMALASLLGSVTVMPGFIAFPLAGILVQKEVAYMVVAAFTTTLMMVGVLTAPIEKAYFGLKVTVIRNIISFFIALVVAVVIGLFFGEIFQ
ncbi:MAG: permease [Dehalococcoidales bacterium]